MLPLSPDAAIACLTFGMLLIYWELNRPGTVLPGALGLLAVLFSVATLVRVGPHPMGILLVAVGTVLLALGLFFSLPLFLPVAATLALTLGLYTLIQPLSIALHAATSLMCGTTLGMASTRLTAIAYRARCNKRSAYSNQGFVRSDQGLD